MEALADPFTTLSGRRRDTGSSATFPDNNRIKVWHEKSRQMQLTRGKRLAQINGTLPTSHSHRLLPAVCPRHHAKLHCLETFQIKRELRARLRAHQASQLNSLLFTSPTRTTAGHHSAGGHPGETCNAAGTGWEGRSSSHW